MKSKFELKKRFISLRVKLIFLTILLSVVTLLSVGISMNVYHKYGVSRDEMISEFNSMYVDVSSHIIKNYGDSSEEYFNKIAKYYNVRAYIKDANNNVIMSTDDEVSHRYNEGVVRDFYEGKIHTEKGFLQQYNLYIDNNLMKLVIIKDEESMVGIKILFSIIIAGLIVNLFIVYIFINKKVKYILKIVKSIGKIKKGNLEEKIEEKNNDELTLIAKEINEMGENLNQEILENNRNEKYKKDLIANISHDLRTPLTALIAYLQLIPNASDENKKKYTKISLNKADKLNCLIQELFNYSKLESGGVKLNFEEINLMEIIDQSVAEVYLEGKDKGINILNKLTEKVKVIADPLQLSRVFQNVLTNAIKYGEINNKILINGKKERENVIISIENSIENSCEIDDVNMLFYRFYKGDKSRCNSDSSGLGLAISRSIIELHHGNITGEIIEDKFVINIELPIITNNGDC